MNAALRLSPIFLGILATLPACPIFGCTEDDITYDSTQPVDAAALADAQADGMLELAECQALCNSTPGGSTSVASTTSAEETGPADGSTSGATNSTTAPGGTDGGSTGDESSSSSSSSSSESTGDQNTTGAGGFGDNVVGCSAVDGDPESIVCSYETECVGGRRPAGLRSSVRCSADEIGTWFAATAHLEAASVPAFERLLAELRAHGAPEALQSAALRAIDDERRHAELMQAQARRCAVSVRAVEIEPLQPRSLFAMAVENVVEGCVRETWAALVAMHQAQAAEDPRVRALMAEIAADETRHAELAWAVDAWVRTQLDHAQIQALDAARASAAAELCATEQTPPAWIRELGLPSREQAKMMHRALGDALWAA